MDERTETTDGRKDDGDDGDGDGSTGGGRGWRVDGTSETK